MIDELAIIEVDWDVIKQAFHALSHSGLFTLLVVLIATDFITGTFHGFLSKELDSSVGTAGLIKHSTILILATIIGVVLNLMGMGGLASAFLSFYVAEYSLSIIENSVGIGVPFPSKWKRYFVQIKDDIDNDNEGVN